MKLDYSRPDTPPENAYIESCDGGFRAERLDTNWFISLEIARDKAARWRRDCNEFPSAQRANIADID